VLVTWQKVADQQLRFLALMKGRAPKGGFLTNTIRLAHVRMKSKPFKGDRRYAVGLSRKPCATICKGHTTIGTSEARLESLTTAIKG
jgi:hypothetical protein